jgi:hypothetical protein
MQTDGRADRRTVRNMIKVIGAFRNFANAPKKSVFDNRTPLIYSTTRYWAEITSVDRYLLIKDTKEKLASLLTYICKLDMYIHTHIHPPPHTHTHIF